MPFKRVGTRFAQGPSVTLTGGIMIRFTTLTACLALSLAFAAGCNKASDEQHKADNARAEADNKVAEANRDATDKINAAQSEADKKVAEAQANFLKLREDYRHSVTDDLVSVDKKIADLEAKAKTAKAPEKSKIEAALPSIRSQREAVSNEYRSLELASAITWDDTKARVNKAIDDLKKAVDKAD
jgi:regulator of protease activity HflC (stomatin/prohibitin superfamily)